MDFRLTIYPALEEGRVCAEYSFKTRAELDAARNTCAALLIFMQDEAGFMPDYSNMFISEEMIDGEWEEIEPEDQF